MALGSKGVVDVGQTRHYKEAHHAPPQSVEGAIHDVPGNNGSDLLLCKDFIFDRHECLLLSHIVVVLAVFGLQFREGILRLIH